jgi:hypothetical protein
MNGEQARVCKVVAAYFKVLTRHQPEVTDEDKSDYFTRWPRFKLLPNTNTERYRYLVCSDEAKGNRYLLWWLQVSGKSQVSADVCIFLLSSYRTVMEALTGKFSQELTSSDKENGTGGHIICHLRPINWVTRYLLTYLLTYAQ